MINRIDSHCLKYFYFRFTTHSLQIYTDDERRSRSGRRSTDRCLHHIHFAEESMHKGTKSISYQKKKTMKLV